jgi:hypothetical protein
MMNFFSYFKKQSVKKVVHEEEGSEAGSVSDTEFDQYLSKTETDGGLDDEDWALDIAE